MKKPISNGKLAITGTILVTLVLHLKTFRFERGLRDSHVDLYNLQMEVFKDFKQVLVYLVSIGCVWDSFMVWMDKGCVKNGCAENSREPYTLIGHLLIWPLLLGFAVVPVYMHVKQLPEDHVFLVA